MKKTTKGPLGFAYQASTTALERSRYPARSSKRSVALPVASVCAGLLAMFALGAVPARLVGAEWIEAAKVTASDPGTLAQFGYSVAIHGDRLTVGAVFDDAPEPDSGSVYAFERDASGVWFEAARLTASDGGRSWNLGTYVAIWGNVIAATAPGADPDRRGATYVFERDEDGVWRETSKLVAPDGSAFTGGVTVWGDTIVVGTALERLGFGLCFRAG